VRAGSVRALDGDDRDNVVAVLVDAFRAYPVMRHVLGPAGEGLDALLGFYTDQRFENGWPVLGVEADDPLADDPNATQRLVGVALMTPPEPRATEATAHLERDLSIQIGEEAYRRLLAFEAASDANEPPGRHHFLGMLAVRRSAQGLGHSRTLLDAVKQVAIDEGTRRVVLSTEDPKNLALYEHLGFRQHGHQTVEGTPPLDTWCLIWEADAT